jgi:phage gp36-like protein
MGYSTEAEVRESKYEDALSNVAGIGAEGTAKITAAILYADSQIDYYCNSKYTVPFSPVPDIIKQWSICIAVCWLYNQSDVINDQVQQKCDKIMEELEKIRDGDATIPDLSKNSNEVEYYTPFTESKFGTGVLE